MSLKNKYKKKIDIKISNTKYNILFYSIDHWIIKREFTSYLNRDLKINHFKMIIIDCLLDYNGY